MSTVVPVPPELESFIRSHNAQTLLIRGPPGSGKTMLSFALLRAFPGRRIYASLRVDRPILFKQFPWLADLPPGELDVIDTAEQTDHVTDRGQFERKELLLSHPDEAKELQEFHWLPKAVQAAWVLASDEKPTMIVFDSWDAIIDQYFERTSGPAESYPGRAEIERLLISRMMKKQNVSLVLVLERDSPSILDYIVHGIVETSRRLEGGRLERWLSLPKLRGTPIPVDTYPFTLAGGRFTAIMPTYPSTFLFQNPVPDPTPGVPGQWPGSTDYADVFGRLLPGRVTMIALASSVPRELPGVIMAPMLLQTIGGGGRALFFAAPTLDPEDIFAQGDNLIAQHGVSPNFRVMTSAPLAAGPAKSSGMFVPFHWSKTVPSVPIPDDEEFLRATPAPTGQNLIVLYISGLLAAAENAGVTIGHGFLTSFATALFPEAPVHILIFGRDGEPYFEKFSPICETLIDVRYTNGRVFLSGHRPYSAPLVLSYEGHKEPFRLTPIV
jgi:KaiC/GvpD/RAD55 family RecA-like ATPase